MNSGHDSSRRARSQAFATPTSSRPFEPLVLVAALACLVVHLLAISALNELAFAGGQIDEARMAPFARIRVMASLTAVLSLLALLRIWWRGFTRQGLALAGYGVIVSVWIVFLLSWSVLSETPHDDRSYQPSTAFLWLVVIGLGIGVLIHEGWRWIARPWRLDRPRRLTIVLVLLLLASTALVTGSAWVAEMVHRWRLREAYAVYLPASSTAEGLMQGIVVDHPRGVVLMEGHDGYRVAEWSDRFEDRLRADALKRLGVPCVELVPPLMDLDPSWAEMPDLPSSEVEDIRACWDSWEECFRDEAAWYLGHGEGPIPEEEWRGIREWWRSRTLFVALSPKRSREDLQPFLDWALEIRPEQRNVMLLTARSWPARDLGLMVAGLRRMPLSALPLELHEISGATGVEIWLYGGYSWSFQIGGHDIEALSFAESPRPEDLAREVAGLGSDAVNILNSSSLSLEHLVEVVDALREAGVERVAIPGRPPVREPEEPR